MVPSSYLVGEGEEKGLMEEEEPMEDVKRSYVCSVGRVYENLP